MKQLSTLTKTLILATAFVALPALAAWNWDMGGVLPAETSGPTGNFNLFLNTSNTPQYKPGSLGIGTAADPAEQLEVNGNILQQNTNTLRAKNSAGVVETWMWPRYSNNVTYTNFGTGGWNIRNNASVSSMFLQNGGNVGIGTATPATKLDVNYAGIINTTTPGLALYNLHLSPSVLTPDYATGITFGSTNGASVPQAGIYVQSSGAYGTKMYFGTTNSYATGSKTNMMIDSTGNVGMGTTAPGAKLEVAGQVKITGGTPGANKVLTSDATGLASWATPAGSGITASSATTNYLSKWTGATALGNSQLFDNGTNVGIGTALPATKLDVYQASDAADNAFALRSFSAPSTRYTSIWSGSGGSVIDAKGVSAGSGLLLRVNGTDRMMIQDSGSVGIGTVSPESRLQIGDATVSTANQIIFGKADTASESYLPVIQQKSILSAGASNDLALGARSTNGGILFYTGATSAGTGTTGGALGTSSNAARMTINSTGNVGIGTTAPAYKLHVSGGDIGLDQPYALKFANGQAIRDNGTGGLAITSGASIDNTVGAGGSFTVSGGDAVINGVTVGRGAGAQVSNTAVGSNALISNTTGNLNTASGVQALFFNMTGSVNTAVGFNALMSNNASNNTAVGYSALASNSAGSNGTAVGYGAMQYSNSTATAFTNDNVAVGFEALRGSTTASANTGTANTAVGYQALNVNTSGTGNTATGWNSLMSNTTGDYNTANGRNALRNNTTGSDNTAIGWKALFNNDVGYSNTANGEGALFSNTSGVGNTANGLNALYSNTTGNQNTAIGLNALYSNTTGYTNTAIGYGANVTSGALFNVTAIGNGASVNASNKIVLGNASATTVGGYGVWSNYSDARLKENIYYKNDLGLDFITALETASFNYKADVNKVRHDGLIAQDIQATLKKLGVEWSGLIVDNDPQETLNVSYEMLTIPLINSVKELKSENDTLSAKVEKLQSDNAALLARIEAIEAKLK